MSVTPAAGNRENRRIRSLLAASPMTLLGFAIIALMTFMALAAPWIATHDPLVLDIRNRLAPPSVDHWFGTDEVGRDLYSRVVYGARLSLVVAVSVVLVAASTGLLVGCYAGLAGGRAEAAVMRVVDVMLSIPGLVLAMALTAALGPSLQNAMLALVIVIVPTYIRLARGQARAVRTNAYVEAAVLFGAPRWHILRRHVIPNSLTPILVQATLDLGNVILFAAALSFIGLGAQPPDPEWGALIGSGRHYLHDHWWYATFPGLAIVIAAVGFNLAGDGLCDLLDPRVTRGGR